MSPPPLPSLHVDTSSSQAVVLAGPMSSLSIQLPLPDAQVDALSPTPSATEGSELLLYDQHRRDLAGFRRTFDKHMKNKPVKHEEVHVFMWTWNEKHDDLKVKEEVDDLQAVFEKLYSFAVVREELTDLETATHELNYYLAKFMKAHDKTNSLLIFYYAGHGLSRNNDLHFVGTKAQQTEEQKDRDNVAWSGAEKIIRARFADVLVIFDCCEAGAFGGVDISSRAAEPLRQLPFQCLAACRSTEPTRRPSPQSFTSALIWALTKLRDEHPGPFTANNLLLEVKKYKKLPKTQHPCLLKRDVDNYELIWLSALNIQEHEEAASPGETRDPRHEYLDIRLNFYRRVVEDDAKAVAKVLSRLIQEDSNFDPRHVVLLDKNSVHQKAILNFQTSLKRKRSISGPAPTPSPASSRVRRTSRTSSITYAQAEEEVDVYPAELDPPAPQPVALQKLADTEPEPLPPQSGMYHLRMALHCLLQSVRSYVGCIAVSIQPSPRRRQRHLGRSLFYTTSNPRFLPDVERPLLHSSSFLESLHEERQEVSVSVSGLRISR